MTARMASFMDNPLPWILVLAAGVNSCIGNLMLKQSRIVAQAAGDAGLLTLLLSPWFLGGLAFYGVNVILFAKALDKLPVAAAYPVLAGVGFALLTVSASWFFGDSLGWKQYAGLVAILCGIVLMASQ